MKRKFIIFLVAILLIFQVASIAGARTFVAERHAKAKPEQKTFMIYRETPSIHNRI